MPVVHSYKPPLSHFLDPGRAEYQANFRDGHARGREHGTNGRFEQSLAAGILEKPGFGEGYKAGHRLAKIERERRR
jgi:hypothetical protein